MTHEQDLNLGAFEESWSRLKEYLLSENTGSKRRSRVRHWDTQVHAILNCVRAAQEEEHKDPKPCLDDQGFCEFGFDYEYDQNDPPYLCLKCGRLPDED